MKMGSLISSSPLPTSVPTPTPLFDPSNHPTNVVWCGSVQDFLSYLVFSFNLGSWHLCRVQQRKDPVEKNSPHECITLQLQTAAFVPAERWIRLDRYEDSVLHSQLLGFPLLAHNFFAITYTGPGRF
jgi:hypothetical protein